jgi:hypothetical protein
MLSHVHPRTDLSHLHLYIPKVKQKNKKDYNGLTDTIVLLNFSIKYNWNCVLKAFCMLHNLKNLQISVTSVMRHGNIVW